MELLSVSEKINLKITELDQLKNDLHELAVDKAFQASNYESNIAKSILKLKEEGQPASILEKLARGLCANDKFNMDLSESKYKNHLKIIDLTEAQLNGYQSINRHLSET